MTLCGQPSRHSPEVSLATHWAWNGFSKMSLVLFKWCEYWLFLLVSPTPCNHLPGSRPAGSPTWESVLSAEFTGAVFYLISLPISGRARWRHSCFILWFPSLTALTFHTCSSLNSPRALEDSTHPCSHTAPTRGPFLASPSSAGKKLRPSILWLLPNSSVPRNNLIQQYLFLGRCVASFSQWIQTKTG